MRPKRRSTAAGQARRFSRRNHMLMGRTWLLPIIVLLSACNMVISETPMFAESDRAIPAPKDGIWLADVDDCEFDASQPEAEWPECALWVAVRNSGHELLVSGGKGQSQRLDYLIAAGNPSIIQGKQRSPGLPTTDSMDLNGSNSPQADSPRLQPGQSSAESRIEPAPKFGHFRESAPTAGPPPRTQFGRPQPPADPART